VPREPGGVGQLQGEPLHPSIDGDVVHVDAAFGQQFLDVAVGQAVAQVPAHRHDDHLGGEPETGKTPTAAATRSEWLGQSWTAHRGGSLARGQLRATPVSSAEESTGELCCTRLDTSLPHGGVLAKFGDAPVPAQLSRGTVV